MPARHYIYLIVFLMIYSANFDYSNETNTYRAINVKC